MLLQQITFSINSPFFSSFSRYCEDLKLFFFWCQHSLISFEIRQEENTKKLQTKMALTLSRASLFCLFLGIVLFCIFTISSYVQIHLLCELIVDTKLKIGELWNVLHRCKILLVQCLLDLINSGPFILASYYLLWTIYATWNVTFLK